MKVKLVCSLCHLTKECDAAYFATHFLLLPHHSDDKYTFSCSECADKPVLKHHEKEWEKIGLCALTTLQFVSTGNLFTAEDVVSFVDSHFYEIAVGKDYSSDWRNELIQEMKKCNLIHWQAGNMCSLSFESTTRTVFFPEECLELRDTDVGEKDCKIRWTGFSAKFATWEPFANLRHCYEIFTTQQKETLYPDYKSTAPLNTSVNLDARLHQSDNSTQALVCRIKEENFCESEQGKSEGLKKHTSKKRPHSPESAEDSDSDFEGDTGGEILKIDGDSDYVIDESDSDFYEDDEGDDVKPTIAEFVPNRVTLQIRKNFRQKAMLSMLEKGSAVRTLHHTFTVACSKCGDSVPVKDLGDDVISPICVGWFLSCAKCTKGKHHVEHPATSVGGMVLRALFMLHVKNPAKEFWDAADIGNVILTNPSFHAHYTQNFKASIRIKLCALVNSGKVKSLCRGSGFYQYIYDQPGEPNTISLPPPSIPLLPPPPPPPPTPGHLRKRRRGEERREREGRESQGGEERAERREEKTAVQNSQNDRFPQNVAQDIFIQFLGEDETFGFVQINLDLTLSELRKEMLENQITENGDFIFLFKKAPVRVPQESKLVIRKCVFEKEDGLYIQLKKNA